MRMIPRFFLILLLVGILSAVVSRDGFAAEGRQPNVLLIMTDDQGWGDIGSHGNPKIDTPALDRLASQGVRFERFFVSPVCAPTRASLLTGRYHRRTGTHGVTRSRETMRGAEVTLAEAFGQAGYATGCFGKWHNGANYPHHPTGQGFDQFFGFCAGHWNNYFHADLEQNGQPVKTQGYITDVLTDRTIDFIEQNRTRPFFCYLPYNTPHSPWQVEDRYLNKYLARGLDLTTACAYAMCENIDDNVARLLAKLDKLQLSEETIVLFLTDNGPNSDRYNGGMKGRKGSIHEGGVRVPLFIRWPGHIAAGQRVEEITSHIDLFPTLVALTGIPLPKTLPWDGMNLVPLIENPQTERPDQLAGFQDRLIFSQWRNRGSVRSQRYRSTKGELYDMRADPEQTTNIAAEYPEIQQRLQAAYEAWFKEVNGEGLMKIVPTEVGHPEWKTVTLPGHEAQLFPPTAKPSQPRIGLGISYNGRAGFANDWVTNWTDINAYPHWDIKVVGDGRYGVTLMYSCPASDVGSEFVVEIADQQLSARVSVAHDPPLLKRPNRIQLHHGSDKDKVWAKLDVGHVQLKRGPARVVVRTKSKPGKRVMDLKAVKLRRLD